MGSKPGIRILEWLERGGRLLRAAGLGTLVDRIGPFAGKAASRFEVEIDGLRLVGNHVGQLYYLREIAEQGRESFFVDLIRHLTPSGGAAVDGGAHIGYVTLQLARAVGEEGHVWAFEPNPEVQATLRENIRRNGCASRVTVVPKALGAEAASTRFHISGGGDTSSLVDPGTTRRAVDVDVVSLDDELDPSVVPDVVKLDLEGGELYALEGMRNALARCRPRPILFVECNPPLLAAAGASAADLLAWLAVEDFRVWRIDESERVLLPAGEGVEGFANLVCARGDHAARLLALQRGSGCVRRCSRNAF